MHTWVTRAREVRGPMGQLISRVQGVRAGSDLIDRTGGRHINSVRACRWFSANQRPGGTRSVCRLLQQQLVCGFSLSG